MTSLIKSDQQTRPIPVDFASGLQAGLPVELAEWPVSLAEQRSAVRRFVRGFLDACSQTPEPEACDALILAYGRLTAHTLLMADAALALDAIATCGVKARLVGNPVWLDYLKGEDRALSQVKADQAGWMNTRVAWPPRYARLRRLKHNLSWRRPRQLGRRLYAPDAVAISKNPLLLDHVDRCRDAIAFRSANEWLGPIHRDRKPRRSASIDAAAQRAAISMVEPLGLTADLQARLITLIEQVAREYMAWAAGDLAALNDARHLPTRMLSGTGNNWSVRALALASRRRGGHLTSFAHGRGHGTPDLPEVLVGNELLVSDRFVFVTEATADMARASGVLDMLPDGARPDLGGHAGRTTVKWTSKRRVRSRGPRRVLYPGYVIKGSFARLPAPLPDRIYLDWQLRLVGMVSEMPLELLCRPHPEGHFAGAPHPLASIVPVRPEPFEILAPLSDVILCDTPSSTTFYEALVSDRIVVLLDIYRNFFVPEFQRAIERRCRIVEVTFDERNRPIIDRDVLQESICGGPAEADPAEMRELLFG